MVVFVGYQASGTRGRSLVDGASRVKIHGEWVPVRAEVARLDAFSAHADREELVRWVNSADDLPRRIALVHGEPDGRRALAEVLRDRLGTEVVVPRHGSTLAV
jgi:metallo-beta-lactamase family protein